VYNLKIDLLPTTEQHKNRLKERESEKESGAVAVKRQRPEQKSP